MRIVASVRAYTFRVLKTPARISTMATLSEAAKQQDSIRLYQYAICPFCARVKTLLNYAGIDYDAIEVNPLTKAELSWYDSYHRALTASLLPKILTLISSSHNRSEDYKKVPVLTLNDEPILGSDLIVEKILARPETVSQLNGQWRSGVMNMQEFSKSPSAQTWNSFATDQLGAVLYPNLCRSWLDAVRAFGYVDKVDAFGVWNKFSIRYAGATAMYLAASKLKSAFSLQSQKLTSVGVEAAGWILLLLNVWCTHRHHSPLTPYFISCVWNNRENEHF